MATIRQSDIEKLRLQYRITDIPLAVRTERNVEAGGFADASRNPNTWTAYLFVDGQWAQIESARGLRREWTSLDRLERWLRSMGFRAFAVRNDVEPAGPQAGSAGVSMK